MELHYKDRKKKEGEKIMSISFEKMEKNCLALRTVLAEKNKQLIDRDASVNLIAYANMRCGDEPEQTIEKIPYLIEPEQQSVIVEKAKKWVSEEGRYGQCCYNLCNEDLAGLCEECKFKDVIQEPSELGEVKDDYKIKIKSFPTKSLPKTFKALTLQASRSIKCPPDFIATSLLVASSALIGTARTLEITPTWKTYCSLSGCLIGTSSSKKSPGMGIVMKHIEDIENELLEKFIKELESFNQSNNNNALQKPILERITTNNTTVEALIELLSQNKKGIFLFSDELKSWINSMGEYKSGKNGDKQFFLSAWNVSRYVYDRKGKDPTIIMKAFVSVLGSIQPEVLRELENAGDGFFERIIFCFPEFNKSHLGSSTEAIDPKIEKDIKRCFKALHELFNKGVSLITLTTDARKCFEAFEGKLANAVSDKYFNPYFDSLYSKISGTAAKIALILHCVKEEGLQLSRETMESAVEITEYYLEHSKHAMGLISKEITQRLTDTVYKWLLQKDHDFIQPSTISKYNIGGINSAEEAKVVLNNLIKEHKIIYNKEGKKYLLLKE